jgi:hypothetical protein
VKILKVERVIPHLVNGDRWKFLLAYFELEHEDHRPDQHEYIDPFPQSWN